jgi:hypothetical protein
LFFHVPTKFTRTTNSPFRTSSHAHICTNLSDWFSLDSPLFDDIIIYKLIRVLVVSNHNAYGWSRLVWIRLISAGKRAPGLWAFSRFQSCLEPAEHALTQDDFFYCAGAIPFIHHGFLQTINSIIRILNMLLLGLQWIRFTLVSSWDDTPRLWGFIYQCWLIRRYYINHQVLRVIWFFPDHVTFCWALIQLTLILDY